MNNNVVAETVEFNDNKAYAAVCGPMDRNLSIVEHVADVSISRSGNRLLLQGSEENVLKSKEIFDHLNDRHRTRGIIEEEDVKGALRFSGYEVVDVKTPLTPAQSSSQTEEITTPRKSIQARSPNQAQLIKQLKANALVFGIGPAGTGKTYIAVAAAVQALTEGKVERIILSRPAVEAGERIGFLPGDMKEKVDPYMQPLYDALSDSLPPKQLSRMYEDKTIEIAPLAFMRGRTLSRAFVVLDEAQNASIPQMKMFLTRLGQDAQMAITGDQSQIDLSSAKDSGLIDAVRRLSHIPEVGITEFTSQDVVRHPLVAKIIRAYDG